MSNSTFFVSFVSLVSDVLVQYHYIQSNQKLFTH